MKLVISATLLSAMVFYSSLLPFLHSLNLYISATIHKNYMFLLCNGILVFVVRNSGLIGNSRSEPSRESGRGAEAQVAAMGDESREIDSKVENGEELGNGLIENEEEIERLITEDEEEENEDERLNFYDNDEEEEEIERLITEDEEEENEDERLNFYDNDEEEEEEVGALSTEELNKKCEEFIRKMKAGIKFESQQVLVL